MIPSTMDSNDGRVIPPPPFDDFVSYDYEKEEHWLHSSRAEKDAFDKKHGFGKYYEETIVQITDTIYFGEDSVLVVSEYKDGGND